MKEQPWSLPDVGGCLCPLRICAMYEAKKQQDLQLMACNSETIVHKSTCPILKDGIITELSTKISRSAVFASCIARILK